MTAARAEAQRRLHLAYTTFVHSGGAPCRLQALGLSDQQVRGTIRELRRLGLDLQTLRGQGHRLRYPLAPLHADALAGRSCYRPLAACYSIWNCTFCRTPPAPDWQSLPRPSVPVSFWQRARPGGGVAGTIAGIPRWVPGSTFPSAGRGNRSCPAAMLAMLPAVAIMRALQELGIHNAGLKWPNDILLRHGDGRKLGGILTETRTRAPRVVIGIGLNVRLPETGALPTMPTWWMPDGLLPPEAN